MAEKSSGLAAVLNFIIPGVGFIYMGRVLLGFAAFFGISFLFMIFFPFALIAWIIQVVMPFTMNKTPAPEPTTAPPAKIIEAVPPPTGKPLNRKKIIRNYIIIVIVIIIVAVIVLFTCGDLIIHW